MIMVLVTKKSYILIRIARVLQSGIGFCCRPNLAILPHDIFYLASEKRICSPGSEGIYSRKDSLLHNDLELAQAELLFHS